MDSSFPWIAVVDDEAPVRRALTRLLRSADLAAQAFAGGADFLAALAPGRLPYCVILDLHMPDMSGFEVQAQLARLAPALPVIVVTGQHSPETEARARRNPLLAYLHKPMNDSVLLAAIRSLPQGEHHA